MQQSNAYILGFTAVMTLILGGVLSFTSVTLRPLQIEQEELQAKKIILGAVKDISEIAKDEEKIAALYDERVQSFVINSAGEVQSTNKQGAALVAERINMQKNHKIPPEERYFPVYLYREGPASERPTAYVFPMFGTGLWDWISGCMALEGDLNTVRGMVFDHKTETPGLGARIASAQVQGRYRGKQIFDRQGALVAVSMIKGEKGEPLDPHHVDGMSGATMTGKGVNTMLKDYLGYYMPYIEKMRTADAKKMPAGTQKVDE